MRYLEVRRHSFTKTGQDRDRGSRLTQEGVSAARTVGAGLGPISYVAVSEVPRTLETAIAMGLAVDDTLPLGSGFAVVAVPDDPWAWTLPYVRYHELLDDPGPLAEVTAAELDLWRSVVLHVGEGEVALIVTHGGSIEPTLVAALPEAHLEGWGPPFAPLDGVRLGFDAGRWILIEFQRSPATKRSPER
jgi:broad specificity phosphatase PhoE